MSVARLLLWATGLVLILTLGFEAHCYWIANPRTTCLSTPDTYLQVRACTMAITLADMLGKPDARLYATRGAAEETNCDLHEAARDYGRAEVLAPGKLAPGTSEVEREYCSRGQNAERAEAVVLSGALASLPYILAAIALVFALFCFASRNPITALLLTVSSISWLVAIFTIFAAAVSFYWSPPFADYIPKWLVQEISFESNVIVPLWCVLISTWLTFFAFRTWPRPPVENGN